MPNKQFPKRAIHLDFHTMPGVYDVGSIFHANKFAQTLEASGVDYITVFARCNLGFAYYPTKVGTVHPSLKIDLLGEMITACHERNIKVAAYFNAGIDHEHALRHREWCKVNKEGQVYNVQKKGHWFRNPCLNTGYGDYLLAMIDEVLVGYPVDGIFLDCFDLSPCYGIECIGNMNNLGMNIFDDGEVQRHTQIITDRFLEDVKDTVKAKGKEINMFFNGIPYRKQPTHIEVEVLPTGGWGYDYLPAVVRYARTLEKPFFVMTGRFHGSWGDFGGIRTEHSLLFDCYTAIANGGTCSIGDHMHPRGKLEPEVYNLIGKVYRQISKMDPWAKDASALTEVAILNPNALTLKQIPKFPDYVCGATRILSELNYQFDVVDEEQDFSQYKVMILPDEVMISDRLKKKLTVFLQNGGSIISSAFSGLDTNKEKFALSEYRINYEGTEQYNVSFFKALDEVGRDIPEMPNAIYEPGIAVTAQKDAKVLAKLYKPYFNKYEWDWYHENLYIPPEKEIERPVLTQFNNIFHFSFPLFGSYYKHAVVVYKYLLRNCLEKLLPNPIVKVDNFPSFGEVTVTQNENGRIVHLLTYLPELRGKAQMIEEPIAMRNVELSLRMDGQSINNVYLAPSCTQISFTTEDDYVKVYVPEVNGYQAVVFES